MPFRADTSHIFRDAPGHLVEDNPTNRALIRSAISPDRLIERITLQDGSTLERYRFDSSDGTQAWAEVRNGAEITNGGLNVIQQ